MAESTNIEWVDALGNDVLPELKAMVFDQPGIDACIDRLAADLLKTMNDAKAPNGERLSHGGRLFALGLALGAALDDVDKVTALALCSVVIRLAIEQKMMKGEALQR